MGQLTFMHSFGLDTALRKHEAELARQRAPLFVLAVELFFLVRVHAAVTVIIATDALLLVGRKLLPAMVLLFNTVLLFWRKLMETAVIFQGARTLLW